jgi:hypothetical protein
MIGVTDDERLARAAQSWSRATVTSLIAFLLAAGAYSSAEQHGTPPPSWFGAIVIVLGALTIADIVASVVDTALLRRRPPAVRARAVPLAAHHPSRPHAHHHPPRHRVSWAARWVGMLLVLAVVSVPGVVDGVAHLTAPETRSPSTRSPARQLLCPAWLPDEHLGFASPPVKSDYPPAAR